MPKTFAWFEGRKRPPSEYEELTVGLHFGEEALVRTRVGTWTLDSTRLTGVPWEDFRDPAQLHYRSWVALQDRAERELVKRVLEETHGNRKLAATRMNICYKALLNKLKRWSGPTLKDQAQSN